MASNRLTMNGRELKRQTQIEDLGNETTRLRRPFSDKPYCNSVFKPTASCSSGGGGMGTLAYVGIGLAGAAALTPLAIMAFSSGGQPGAQVAGGPVNSKSALQIMQNASDSGNENAILTAIKAGDDTAQGLGTQITSNESTATQAKTDMDTVKGKMETLEKTTIPGLEQELKGLKGELSQFQSELDKLHPNGKDDKDYQAKRTELEEKIKAKQTEIEKKQKEITDAETQLKDFKQVYDNKKSTYDAATDKIKELTSQKEKVDAELVRLRQKLANIQAATKPDGVTAPAGGDTAPVSADTEKLLASSKPVSDKDNKDLLAQYTSTGSAPAAGSDKGSDAGVATGTGSSPVGTKTGDATEDDSYSTNLRLSGIINDKDSGYAAKQGAIGELRTYIKEHPNAKDIESLKRLLAQCDAPEFNI